MSKVGDKFVFEITKTELANDNSNKLVSGELVTFVSENKIHTLKKCYTWTPIEKGFPTEEGMYNVTFADGFVTSVEWNGEDWELWKDSGDVIAWIPMPDKYISEPLN